MKSCLSTPVGYLHIHSEDGFIRVIHFSDEPLEGPYDEAPELQACLRQLGEYFAGSRTHFDFPMQQGGTPFQQSVWNGLLQIPFGKTCSYRDLSKQLGDVKAIRAVGTANGRNQLAIVVPCHRVIGSDRSLTGYAGGLHRKQWLLAHEARHAGGAQQLGLDW
ncbi:methylated-DNA--[protein]-cysteine S-methyltransferase [Flaviaesturariibacter aridisoli]|uniref:Methylated-DNA--protein-cysteine methyltransferase n=1 Tax=Flaviaesturariibacter aridisoli TaxID=2545761 RepID=A0A4R4E504_9BACT|nr:methylated-DNA--[protein]-cysteine S-methyltransferase [Flaviaesturariibacter aridisoli]TCZ73923.1 methylated-DNA--[protein]-cysteine S-methyltransferase [Flaviaesturariibacter aridisoli]